MFEMKRLDEVCVLNMGQSPSSDSYNSERRGLPFFQGNADFGDMYPANRVWCDKPIKIVEPETLLISVRAPIGALNFAKERSCIGRGLAGITATEEVDINYIYYCLESKNAELNDKGTGSTFKAISKNALGETLVKVLPMSVQKQCITTFNEIATIIKEHKKILEDCDSLIKSRFVEMFGDPVCNTRGFQIAVLSELGNLGRGVSKHRPRNAPELLGGPYPLIQTGDVANAGLYITEYESTYSETGLKQSKMWEKGTLCITIAANIAKTAILAFDACFPDSVVGFNANKKTNNIFIHYWFSFFQEILEAQAPESAQKNINLKILSELKVIVPPVDLQEQFAEFVQEVEKLSATIKQSIGKLQNLFDSLMQKYFD